MAITEADLVTREGVLRYPSEAAAYLAANPNGSSNPLLTDAVMATRAGVLRFPNEAASFIANGPTALTEAEWEALTEYDYDRTYVVEGVGEYLGPSLQTPEAWNPQPGDLHVATTGSDTTGNGNQGNPWASIKQAFNSISTSNSGPITIWVDSGTYTENLAGGYFLFTKSFANMVTIRGKPGTLPVIINSTGSYTIRPNNACANVRFRNMEIRGAAGSLGLVFYNGTSLSNFELIECVLTDVNSAATAIAFSGASGQSNIVIKRCIFTSSTAFATSIVNATGSKVIGNDFDNITIANGLTVDGDCIVNSNVGALTSITLNGRSASFATQATVRKNVIRNIVHTGGNASFSSLLNLDYNTVNVSTATVGISVIGHTTNGTCNYNTVDSMGTVGIAWPMDGGSSTCSGHTIIGNDVTNNGTNGHGILVSTGSTNVTVQENNTNASAGGAYGAVIKGTGHTVTDNNFIGGTLHGILFKDATNCTSDSNTITSTAGTAIRFDTATGCTITNSTIIVNAGTLIGFLLAHGTSNVLNNNTYDINGAATLGTLFGNTVNNITDMRNQWLANYPTSPTNDSNSSIV